MKKVKLKSKKKIKTSTKILIIGLFVFLSTIFLLNYINKVMYPVLMKYATYDAKKMALTVFENSISNDVLKELKKEDIFHVSKNNNNEVSNIDFNPAVINKVLLLTSSVVSDNLKKIEKGDVKNLTFINNEDYNIKKLKNGVISELPIGLSFKNSLLSNIGPKIPVKINLNGNAQSYVKTKVENYGINNSIIKVYAHVEVIESVMIPFKKKDIKVSNDVLIAIKFIQGTVPNYLGEFSKNSSSLSLPIDIDK